MCPGRDNDGVRHASPPDSDQTELIDRIDAGQTGQFGAVPPRACPVPDHPAVRRLAARWFWANIVASLLIWSAALVLAVLLGARLAVLLWSMGLT